MLIPFLLCGLVTFAQNGPRPESARYDVQKMGVEGRAFVGEERLRFFDRFPKSAEKTLPESVWNLSRDCAGMLVRFRTDSKTIQVKYRLKSPSLAMPHRPATGKSGAISTVVMN